jgi:hypothetical protein
MKQTYKEFVAPYEALLPKTETEGLQLVCSGKKRSHFSTDILLKSNADKLNCNFVTVPQTTFLFTTTFGMVKRSPYRRLFKYR